MAAEYALMYLGEIDSLTETPPVSLSLSIPQPSSADDFSSDIVLPSNVNSALLSDFGRPQATAAECHVEPSKKPTADSCDDDLPEELRHGDEDDVLSQLVGKNPLTIIGEMQIDAYYVLLAKSDDALHPMFAVEAVVEGERFRAAANSKKLAKARAARDALHKLYNLEFGISDSKYNVFLTH